MCCHLAVAAAAVLLLAAAVHHRVPDDEFVAGSFTDCFISLHLNAICFNVPLRSTVAFTASICLNCILGNYGHARSQGGRQPAAAKPSLHI